MPRYRSLVKLFSYSSFIVVSLLAIFIALALLYTRNRSFNQEVGRMEEKFHQEQLQSVRAKVTEVIEYIDYNRERMDVVLRQDIKNWVDNVDRVIRSIYDQNKGLMSAEEIKTIIKATLRELRFNYGRGYCFIDDLSGRVILDPINPDRENKDYSQVKDARGKFILQDFIRIATTDKEGYSMYYWYRPGEDKKPALKISYVKFFAPFNWIIGVGEYLDDVEQGIQQEVIQRVRKMRYGPDNRYHIYIFKLLKAEGGNDFARSLINPGNPEHEGGYLSSDIPDVKGNYFLRTMLKQLKDKGEGVYENWHFRAGGAQSIQKITFFKYYDKWQWIVGSGFYSDALKEKVLQGKTVLRDSVTREIKLILAILAVILVLAITIAAHAYKKIKEEFKIFINFFQESARKNELIDRDKLGINEFRDLSDYANQMIADKKAGEEALLKAKEIAEAATRSKSEFLANMSHEIRTPMNAIIGMGEILGHTALSAEQHEYLEIINTSANSLLIIINDILDLSKIEAGKLDLEERPFNVRSVIDGVADLVALKANRKGLELITAIEPDIPEMLLGDPARLHQVLLNLADNAVKFTEKGEIVITASMDNLDENDIFLLFKVKDTGVGISEEGKTRLFRTFSQVDGSYTRKYGGTGLGLAISRRLVELMRGEIGVDSRYGKGATFWFTIALKRVKGLPEEERKSLPIGDIRDLRVLVVDDNQTNRRILSQYMVSFGAVCEVAPDAQEAIKKMLAKARGKKPFHVVLIDLNLADLSGADLARQIKQEKELPDTRLVLLSSSIMYKRKELSAVGFDAFLTKPIKQSQLLECIVDIMGWHLGPADRVAVPEVKPDQGNMRSLSEKALDILLVEDNEFNQKIVIFNLKKFGHRVDIAENGEMGVEMFRNKSYNLVLMDVQMPIMDGYEAAGAIRAIESERRTTGGQDAHVPIIAMTANAMKEDKERALNAGMDAHLAKPFSAEKFLYIISTMANKT